MSLSRNIGRFTIGLGLLFIALAVFIPSKTWIAAIRSIPAGMETQLLLGAAFFRLGLALLGVIVFILPRLPFWRMDYQSPPLPKKHAGKAVVASMVIIILLSLFLRLYDLNDGLWIDEILTYVNYAKLPYGEIITTFESENQHFLYSILAHTSFLLFGESAWSLRLPAVLFGVGSILALYLLGREVANEREAILSALLLTFTYYHVWFSQNARGYSGLLFWALLSSWFLVRGLREDRPWLWVGFAFSAALGIYTHLTMVFVVVGQFLVYLANLYIRRRAEWRGRWSGLFLGFALAGFITFFVYAPVIPQLVGGVGKEVSVVSAWKNPIWTALQFIQGLEIGLYGGVAAFGALVLFGAGTWGYLRTRPAVLGLLFIPPVVGAAVVIYQGHHLWPRFFFFAFGFAVLVVIRGAMTIADWAVKLFKKVLPVSLQRPEWIGTAFCLVLVLASILSLRRAYGPKQDYAGAKNYVEQNFQAGDAIVVVDLTAFPYQQYFQTGWPAVTSLDELNQIRSQANRTWLIYTFPPVLESVYPDIMQSIRSDYTEMQDFPGTVDGGAVIVCMAESK